MITYQRLWETMKKRGITQYHLIKRENSVPDRSDV